MIQIIFLLHLYPIITFWILHILTWISIATTTEPEEVTVDPMLGYNPYAGSEDGGSDDAEDGSDNGGEGEDGDSDDGQAGGETEAESEDKANDTSMDGGSGLGGSLVELVRSIGTVMTNWANEEVEP